MNQPVIRRVRLPNVLNRTAHAVVRGSLVLILGLSVLSTGAAQNRSDDRFGIAVDHGIWSALVNPAGIANAPELAVGYEQPFDPAGYTQIADAFNDFRVAIHLPSLSYILERRDERFYHLSSSGITIVPGLSAGVTTRLADLPVNDGTNTVGLSVGILWRPTGWLSTGAVARAVGTGGWNLGLGIALRPLGWFPSLYNGGWDRRVTVYSDVRLAPGVPEAPVAASFDVVGLHSELLDGINLGVEYRPVDSVIGLHIGISFGHNSLSSSIAVGGTPGAAENTAPVPMLRSQFSYPADPALFSVPAARAIEYAGMGAIGDAPNDDPLVQFITGNPARGLRSLLDDFAAIERNAAIEAVVFVDQPLLTDYASILEIRNALQRLRSAGKALYFYYQNMTTLTYALAASVADAIYLHPRGSIDLRGFESGRLYLGDFLDRYGVEIVNFRSHDFKTAYNDLSEGRMTPAEREALEALLRVRWDTLIEMIATGRGDSLAAPAAELVDAGPYYVPATARAAGLVDDLLYEDEFRRLIGRRHAPLVDYTTVDSRSLSWGPPPQARVALIYLTGPIGFGDGVRGVSIGDRSAAEAIRRAAADPGIAGIILRINSGGGSALASDTIAREVQRATTGDAAKPVFVSMGGTAASGGYYIAAHADRIFASPVTTTGSIGVVAALPNVEQLLADLGIREESVRFGNNAGLGSPFRSPTEQEREIIRASIADSYQAFINVVADGRDLSVARVQEIAQGRVWSGRDALALGLIDELGGLQETIAAMQTLVGNGGPLHLEEQVPGGVLPDLSLPGIVQSLAVAAIRELLGTEPSAANGFDLQYRADRP